MRLLFEALWPFILMGLIFTATCVFYRFLHRDDEDVFIVYYEGDEDERAEN